MKLRIRENSIRLRLTQSEVDQLSKTGMISDSVEFGSSREFCYELRTLIDVDTMRAKFEENLLRISIPMGEAKGWIGSEQVGIEEMQPLGGNKFLRILVEKDFECLAARPGEDESDMFPNPGAASNGIKCTTLT